MCLVSFAWVQKGQNEPFIEYKIYRLSSDKPDVTILSMELIHPNCNSGNRADLLRGAEESTTLPCGGESRVTTPPCLPGTEGAFLGACSGGRSFIAKTWKVPGKPRQVSHTRTQPQLCAVASIPQPHHTQVGIQSLPVEWDSLCHILGLSSYITSPGLRLLIPKMRLIIATTWGFIMFA